MSIANKDIKILYGKAAGRCSICKKKLLEGDINLGEMAHIIAKSQNGPRGHLHYSGNINEYNNLILLCLEHHTRVDRNPREYSEDCLQTCKVEHEKWVDIQLSTNKFHKEDSEFLQNYLEYVPFLQLERFIDSLPNSIDLCFFDFTYIFESCCKDLPHLYPLNENFYLQEFINQCTELEEIISGYLIDNNGLRINFFEGSINNKTSLNKEIPWGTRNEICEQLKIKRDELLSKYQDLISFIRNNHSEIDLRLCGKKYYEN